MTRPKKREEEKRVVQVNIRLTKVENDKALSYAEASGISPANWIRHRAFTGEFPAMKKSLADASLYRELRKIGVNLNQIAHRINLGEHPAELSQVLSELKERLQHIIQLLLNDGKPG